ncbi:MAG: nucleotide exchange factor GrpE [Aquificae bacterium]|nr:nucleotide exchange factor GrpE [Aquificota bacterium]
MEEREKELSKEGELTPEGGATKETEPSELEKLKAYAKTLEEKVRKLENLAKASNERLVNLQRELELVRSRHRMELEEKNRYGIEKFARDLLEVLDNFERALDHMREVKECAEVYKGVEMIYLQMKRIFEKHGITEIVVERFDHSLCEAVSAVPTAEAEENSILQVVQKGYKLHDRVLRPAKVVVAVKPEEKQE